MSNEVLSQEGADTILVDGFPMVMEMIADAGADLKPGYVAEQTAITTVGANAVGGTKPMGVAEIDKNLDMNTAFASGAVVKIYLLGSACKVRSYMDKESSATVWNGQLVIAGNSTSGAWDLAGQMTNSDIRELIGRVGRYDATVDGYLRIGHLILNL